MDRHTVEQRHKNMQAVKNKDTKIEIALRKELWDRGVRYQKNAKDVFGKPDIVFKGKKVAVFCDSEFWHGYDWENKKANIKSNREFWIPKIERNIERDKEVNAALEADGWKVLRFWGKEIKKNVTGCANLIVAALERTDRPFKTVDLCAGIGGIRRGFELAGGFTNVASAETDEMACRTYEHLFGNNPRSDVKDVEFKKYLQTINYDVLLAGFPCQAFSKVGKQKGFKDKTKGTIFFDITQIIKMTSPKVVFLENVQNLLFHDHHKTFRIILETLEKDLDYHVIGVSRDQNDNLQYKPTSFLRNTRDFGIPQNRPRVYIVAFSRAYFGKYISLLPDEIPTKRFSPAIYRNLDEILDLDVDAKFFLSSGYLDTLEKHIVAQHKKGYGFGYRVVNAPGIEHPVANTLLATGGSGKERNLIYDPINGSKFAGMHLKGKYSPINVKFIRRMTPSEWGKLQGFIGYGFVNQDGKDEFSFPQGISDEQKYKQFGNSVTIPVVEEFAAFIKNCVDQMYEVFSPIDKRLFDMYGNEFLLGNRIKQSANEGKQIKTLSHYFDMVQFFGEKEFSAKDTAIRLNVSLARAYQILSFLVSIDCVERVSNGMYSFKNLMSDQA